MRSVIRNGTQYKGKNFCGRRRFLQPERAELLPEVRDKLRSAIRHNMRGQTVQTPEMFSKNRRIFFRVRFCVAGNKMRELCKMADNYTDGVVTTWRSGELCNAVDSYSLKRALRHRQWS